MNKMIKGALAGGAGVVLLMGSFGTFALWNDSTTIDNDALASGALDITDTGPAVWADVSTTGIAGGAAVDPDVHTMVPGDTWTLTQPVDIAADGKNLAVDFSVTGIDPGTWSTLDVSMTYAGQPLTKGADGFARTFTAPAGESLDGTKDLVVTFAFPASVVDQDDQGEGVDLSAVGVAVTQTRP